MKLLRKKVARFCLRERVGIPARRTTRHQDQRPVAKLLRAGRRWAKWEVVEVPLPPVFTKNRMFLVADKEELVRRGPFAERIDLVNGNHDA